MTNKKAIKEIEELLNWYLAEEEGVSETYRKKDAVKMAIDALKNVDRNKSHEWHDLRENLCDLPEYYKNVVVAIADKVTGEIDEDIYITHFGMSNPLSRTNEPMNIWYPPFEGYFYDYEIIAWREIEPFKQNANLKE